MLLFFTKHLKKTAYNKFFEKYQNFLTEDFIKGLDSSDKLNNRFSDYLNDILRISKFINEEECISADVKQKSFEFLSNKEVFMPFDYTKFKEIMQSLLKKIQSEDSKFTKRAIENPSNSAIAIETIAIEIKKLASYFSVESLQFYISYFMKFCMDEMK